VFDTPPRCVLVAVTKGRSVTRAFRELAGSNAIVADVSDADEVRAPSRTTVSQLGASRLSSTTPLWTDGWHCCT
jgi:hypothetical protein